MLVLIFYFVLQGLDERLQKAAENNVRQNLLKLLKENKVVKKKNNWELLA